MKALAWGVSVLTFAVLGLVQWFALVDGLREVLGWPSFLCWLVALFFAWIPVVGAAAGIWGARVAWGWDWPPAFALFFGVPALALVVVVLAGAIEGIRLRKRHP